VQDLSAKSICEQSEYLHGLSSDLVQAQLKLLVVLNNWKPELNEFFREEGYMETSAHDFLTAMLEFLEAVNGPTSQLVRHHAALCDDLERVERGQSFSV